MKALLLFVLFIELLQVLSEELKPACFSNIYCYGPILEKVQMAKIFEDSKTFVDVTIKHSPKKVLKNFERFSKNLTDKKAIEAFVKDNFHSPGSEFENWEPKDWKERPKFVENIRDKSYRSWALSLNNIWKQLGRKLKKGIKEEQERYSIIWVPNPVIVPGGRFREYYYWDSYWIILGLLLSEMHNTAKGMLENFSYIVETYGFIPNGGRIYYLGRSQPPLFIPAVKLYFDFVQDKKFLKDNIEQMEKEFDYWMKNHCKNVFFEGINYTLAFYSDKTRGPRPESFREDVKTASVLEEDKRGDLYSELKASAESGWDFSSRWFIKNGSNKGNLTDTKIRSIVPVDLNAILHWNARLLSEFHSLLGDRAKAQNYDKMAKKWLQSLTSLLWDEKEGIWLDFDTINNKKRNYFTPSNLFPLWTGSYDHSKSKEIAKSAIKYLKKMKVMLVGGIPTTMEKSGQQWDYPNAWPPLQHILIVGLNSTGEEEAQKVAFELAKKWLKSNYVGFKDANAMIEKYDATIMGHFGGGGEYRAQLGFGWTNGIVLDLLSKYSDKIGSGDETKEEKSSSSKCCLNYLLVLVVLLKIFICRDVL